MIWEGIFMTCGLLMFVSYFFGFGWFLIFLVTKSWNKVIIRRSEI